MLILWRVIVKEFLQLRRDKKMLPLIFIAPAFQLLALGYAANLDVMHVPLLLVDRDRSAASRSLVDDFIASDYFELVGMEEELDDVEPWFVRGRAQAALVIDRGFGRAEASGQAPRVMLISDGSEAMTAAVSLSYARDILLRRQAAWQREQLARSSRSPAVSGQLELATRIWYNPDLKSRWFYVPAVLAYVLMVVTMVLSSMGVVREKEIGTMEQVIVTPIRSWQLIIGKLFPFAVVGLIDTLLITAVAAFWFEVPIRGSFALLLGLTMVLVLNTLGLGLLVSTLVKNQQQAMMGAAFLLMLPMVFLSGLVFPIENMPQPVQWVTYAIPLRYYATILRGIFLRGSGFAVLWPQALVLAVMGVAFLALASWRFRKRLD